MKKTTTLQPLEAQARLLEWRWQAMASVRRLHYSSCKMEWDLDTSEKMVALGGCTSAAEAHGPHFKEKDGMGFLSEYVGVSRGRS